ncbi:hypothetical protein F9000_07120 [Bacteroides fragilis]|nr:hypothetical protein F9000_07120 [Bacteroides fragilis]KAB5430895.1 hypothetical protein F9Z99_09430 [Bacteroides fragilis]TWV09948.1 hypothetical protein FSA69_07120 [Bacteroides fragilis]
MQIFIHYSNNQLFISSSYIQCTEPKPCFKKGTFFETQESFYLSNLHKLTAK